MKSLKILETRLVYLKCTRPDWNIPARPRSRFTRCLHYLAAFVEHVHRSAWSLPFPVTLENVSLSGGGGARFLGSMACETAGNVASTKFPLPRPPTVPGRPRCRPFSWRFPRSYVFISQWHRCFSFCSTYPPFALGLPYSPCSSFRPSSICPSHSFLHLRATSFLLIYTDAFGPRAVSIETPRREKSRRWRRIGTPAAGRAKKGAIRGPW